MLLHRSSVSENRRIETKGHGSLKKVFGYQQYSLDDEKG